MPINNRIHLLSCSEIESLYALPTFNEVEQNLYFEFTAKESAAANQYRTTKARVYFMLMLGYFKAKQQFFSFHLKNNQDAHYIIKKYFSKTDLRLSGKIDEKTYRKQKKDILNLSGYKNWSSELEEPMKLKLCEFLRYYPKPHSATRQLINYLETQSIMIPNYRILQDLFSAAFSIEEKRLNQLILAIPSSIKVKISELLEKEEGLTQLNIIRADQKDFQYTAVKNEVEKAKEIEELYRFSKTFIPQLKLAKKAVHYYAELTEQYAASRLRRLSEYQKRLHTLCFIHYRYQQIMDNLITSFMYHTKSILAASKTFADISMMEHSAEVVVDFPKLAHFLRWFPKRDKSLSYEELNKEAFNILPESQFSELAALLEGKTFDKKAARWQFYLKSFRILSLYLRPILLTVHFSFYQKNSGLMELIKLLKTHYLNDKRPSDLKFSDDLGLSIPRYMTKYLKKNPKDRYLNPYLLEFFIYQKIYHHLHRGRMYCNESISYCDLDQDLVDDQLVDQIESIAAKFGYKKIPVYVDQRLDSAVEELNHAWEVTTQRIDSKENKGFQFHPDKKSWSLLYDSSEKLDDTFFKHLPKVEIADLVMFVGDLIKMWDGFTHIKGRYLKRRKPEPLAVNACLLSEAFGFGQIKMADMSDLSFNVLRSTREDFIRIDTLCGVNDLISNYIHALPIFKLWNLYEDKLLADIDGQKFATNNYTIQSRYSKKYLGKGKGISLYTLIANFIAVNAKNIGLNEYEGHSLYDMIYGNKTDIDIDMVTGDNHSLNQLNFLVLDSIDVEYVPSIKNLKEAANDLYSIKRFGLSRTARLL